MIYHTIGPRQFLVKTIMVHGSLTRPDWLVGKSAEAKAAKLTSWHEEDGGKGSRYHMIIDRDGLTFEARPYAEIGAGCIGRDKGVLHVCLVGGHGAKTEGQFADKYTDAQDKALRSWIEGVLEHTEIAVIAGHSTYDSGACPGFDVHSRYQPMIEVFYASPTRQST